MWMMGCVHHPVCTIIPRLRLAISLSGSKVEKTYKKQSRFYSISFHFTSVLPKDTSNKSTSKESSTEESFPSVQLKSGLTCSCTTDWERSRAQECWGFELWLCPEVIQELLQLLTQWMMEWWEDSQICWWAPNLRNQIHRWCDILSIVISLQ